jgi:hypothetical protein
MNLLVEVHVYCRHYFCTSSFIDLLHRKLNVLPGVVYSSQSPKRNETVRRTNGSINFFLICISKEMQPPLITLRDFTSTVANFAL